MCIPCSHVRWSSHGGGLLALLFVQSRHDVCVYACLARLAYGSKHDDATDETSAFQDLAVCNHGRSGASLR